MSGLFPTLKSNLKASLLQSMAQTGRGKSAVVDAIDFLLTGKIARLSGEGTEGISLKEYGPHIDKAAVLSNVEVIAEIKIPNTSETIRISRKMSKPNELEFDAKYTAQLTPILELLDRGQYAFTRREVLKLITAKSSTRAQEIQKVLKLSDLEEIRANFVKVQTDSKRKYNDEKDELDKGKRDVLAITGQAKYNDTLILKYVNEQRGKLGGAEIGELEAEKLKDGIAGVHANEKSVNHKSLTERINNLKSDEVEKLADGIADADDTLKRTLKEIKEDVLASWNAKRYRFTEEGIKLLRETGECPLCDEIWPAGELQDYLQARINYESARQSDIASNAKTIIDKANTIKARIKLVIELIPRLTADTTTEAMTTGFQNLNDWSGNLTKLTEGLSKPLEGYDAETFPTVDVKDLYLPHSADSGLDGFEKELKRLFPEATQEQIAWDSLTKLSERLRIVNECQRKFSQASLVFNRAQALIKAYIEARDEVLDGLYCKIKDRFVQLYKEMHGNDENNFDAEFTLQPAGLDLKVDFYGRGKHPPHALHSEGHQDSMGVCLFLALSEYLNVGLIDLIVLDDVVMSVDSGHRRAFCDVLVKNFGNKQFVITTHDTAWANQLKCAGVITGKQMLKFSNWDVDSGPTVDYEADLWGRIQEDLAKDDVSSAAAKLRRGMEEFTRYVCHNLRAKVVYTLDDAGDLGGFLPAAIGEYKELLGKAKVAANSWNRNEVIKALKIIDNESTEIITRSNVEQWNINKAVHYNNWANLEKQDFQPVVNAFKDMYEKVFSCPQEGCQSVLKVTFDGAKIIGVRCNCGHVNWNLNKKPS